MTVLFMSLPSDAAALGDTAPATLEIEQNLSDIQNAPFDGIPADNDVTGDLEIAIAADIAGFDPNRPTPDGGTIDSSEIEVMPIPEGLQHTVLTYGNVTVSGMMPFGSFLDITEIPSETAAALIGPDKTILFAYDIKVITMNGTEYQPDALNPLTVSVVCGDGEHIQSDETPNNEYPTDNPDAVQLPSALPASVAKLDADTAARTPEIYHVTYDDNGQLIVEAATCIYSEDSRVDFVARGFSIYIGTVGTGASIMLTAGSGYKFYSDAACTSVISGIVQNTSDRDIYVKAESNCTIISVTVLNENGTASSVSATETDGIWKMTFPASLTDNQLISVRTVADGMGGTITSASTAAQVAAMFDGSAVTETTDIVNVTKSGSIFTAEIKNNVTLRGTIYVASGVTLNIKSSGNNVIRRQMNSDNASTSFTGNLFKGSAGSTITLGSGYVQNDTVTYFFSDGSSTTVAVSGQVDEPTAPEGEFITYARCNAQVSNTMTGTLIIDGGFRDSFAEYSGTGFSSTTDINCLSLINSEGTVNIWGNVTLQNNKSYSVDASNVSGGGGVNVYGTQARLNFYDGTIRRMINSRFSSDGGAIATINGAMTYIYNGTITECETDTAAAVMIWNAGATGGLAFFNGRITRNLSLGLDTPYGGSAICTYSSSPGLSAGAVKLFGGSISGNSIFSQGSTICADIKMSQGYPSDLYLYGGLVDTIGSAFAPASAYIYAAVVSEIRWTTPDNVHYINGQYLATIPDAVAADGSVTVTAKASRSGVEFSNITTAGSGRSSDLTMLLGQGTYEITITSPSMEKKYVTTVNGPEPTVSPSSRTMTVPKIKSQTDLTLTLDEAGTGNTAADGEISYGLSRTNSAAAASWQSAPLFSLTDTGLYYFFIKAAQTDSFGESISPSVSVDHVMPTLNVGGESITILPGSNHTFEPVVTPNTYSTSNVQWSLSGQKSANTGVTVNSGSATVSVGMDESADEIILTAVLKSASGESLSSDTVTISTVNTQQPNTPTFTVTIPETVNMSNREGSFNIVGQTVDFTNQTLSVSVNSSNNFNLVCNSKKILYKLFLDSQHNSEMTQNQIVAVFNANSTKTVSIYYSVKGTTDYSGTYRDTLTFTVTFNNGA